MNLANPGASRFGRSSATTNQTTKCFNSLLTSVGWCQFASMVTKAVLSKKSPIACYSWESVWGLPAGLRDTATEPVINQRNQQKYDTGHLGVTCLERSTSSNGGGTYDDADDACTIKRRRLGQCGEYDTHNSLGFLAGLFAHVNPMSYKSNIPFLLHQSVKIISKICNCC